MVILQNVLDARGMRKDFAFASQDNYSIDGSKLLVLPALVDPHVHFRVPGMEEKEDWQTGARAALKGGYTTVFDMPNTKPATINWQRLQDKMHLIDSQLKSVGIPIRYSLFFGADKNNFQEIAKVHQQIIGIKIFMGASTGDLLMDDESSLHAIYALAKFFKLPIALHAEDELIIRDNLAKYHNETDFSFHSKIRSKKAAIKAVTKVIELVRIYQVKSYILHVSTRAELAIIADAKKEGLPICAETCPHYLFMNDSYYATLQGKAKMNPPLRSKEDQEYLWQAINEGLIDTIGSDHAPHTEAEKEQPLCKCPSGVPGIETTLPLLLTAHFQGKISLPKILDLLHFHPKQIFELPDNDDLIFVNITDYKNLDASNLATKVKWSPFNGMLLTGFPEYVYIKNKLISVLDWKIF